MNLMMFVFNWATGFGDDFFFKDFKIMGDQMNVIRLWFLFLLHWRLTPN